MWHNSVASKVNVPLSSHNKDCKAVNVALCDEFHITRRAAPSSTFKKPPKAEHLQGSIVPGPDTYVVCRIGFQQPGVDTNLGTAVIDEPGGQLPGTSVAGYAVC